MQVIKRKDSTNYGCFICDPDTNYLSESYSLKHILFDFDATVELTTMEGKCNLTEFFNSPDDYEVIISDFDWPLTTEFLQTHYPELLL